MSLSQESIEATVRAVEDANPLPATLDDFSPDDRKAIEVQARWQGITPEAALATMRRERVKARETHEATEAVLAALRAARS
ncbi:hypothetical protein [Curtobacterium sp. MCPF17_031]|uniref:hypothetical protein n=1 Tax=Curtobacterium sp. MCPF17_031 TaxID=2175653 RepID=UPI000DA927F3|nr:hypothetical protein [Curtobacterium sp. MCPF17_031]PZE34986.1 hypothetical protein DEJ31_12995 [Curtobacterium sp. MCPF17_031]